MLDEEVGFPGLVGLKIDGEPEGTESVVIKLLPGKQHLLKLSQLDANIKWSVKQSVAYDVQKV